jgi:hypothetical protein
MEGCLAVSGECGEGSALSRRRNGAGRWSSTPHSKVNHGTIPPHYSVWPDVARRGKSTAKSTTKQFQQHLYNREKTHTQKKVAWEISRGEKKSKRDIQENRDLD